MKIKEAIEFLEYLDTLDCGNDPQMSFGDRFDEIALLLKHGEKFEAMWEKLKELMKKEPVNKYKCDYCVSLTCNWRFPMNDLEQKYFPKEGGH